MPESIRNTPRPAFAGDAPKQTSVLMRLAERQTARRTEPEAPRTATTPARQPAPAATAAPPAGATGSKNPFMAALERRRKETINQDTDPTALRQRAQALRDRRPR